MKRLLIIFFIAVAPILIANNAIADPRMETNDNFCHFILDADNTDNEVFQAGCDSSIAVEDEVATGQAYIKFRIDHRASPIPVGTELVLTNEDSNSPCNMVDSNNTQYASNRWESRIKVGKHVKHNGLVFITYRLVCYEGQQQ